MKNVIFIVGLLLLSFQCLAGTSTGLISVIVVNAQDQVLVLAGPISGSPECATFERFVVDLSTENGKAMYSLILSAQAQSKKIRILGKNVCNVRSNAESIQYVEVIGL